MARKAVGLPHDRGLSVGRDRILEVEQGKMHRRGVREEQRPGRRRRKPLLGNSARTRARYRFRCRAAEPVHGSRPESEQA